MKIETIARFDNGNGGVSLLLIDDDPEFEDSENGAPAMGKFLHPGEAVELAIDLIVKAGGKPTEALLASLHGLVR